MPAVASTRKEGTVAEEFTPDRIAHLTTSLESGFNDRDESSIEALLSPHLVDHSAALGGVDLRQRLARVHDAFPDATYKVEEYLIQGPAVAWRWTIRGTHAREIMRVAATGKTVEIRGLSMAVFQNGKVVEHWEFPDYDALAAQLGG